MRITPIDAKNNLLLPLFFLNPETVMISSSLNIFSTSAPGKHIPHYQDFFQFFMLAKKGSEVVDATSNHNFPVRKGNISGRAHETYRIAFGKERGNSSQRIQTKDDAPGKRYAGDSDIRQSRS